MEHNFHNSVFLIYRSTGVVHVIRDSITLTFWSMFVVLIILKCIILFLDSITKKGVRKLVSELTAIILT